MWSARSRARRTFQKPRSSLTLPNCYTTASGVRCSSRRRLDEALKVSSLPADPFEVRLISAKRGWRLRGCGKRSPARRDDDGMAWR